MKITHHKDGNIKTLVDEAPYHPGYEDAGFKPSPIKSRVNELIDWILDEVRHADEAEEIAVMLRQQQAEIDFLKKEILAKHEDWKHEGQQAANARAEIDALRMMLTNRNDALDRLDLKSTPCKYTEGM